MRIEFITTVNDDAIALEFMKEARDKLDKFLCTTNEYTAGSVTFNNGIDLGHDSEGAWELIINLDE